MHRTYILSPKPEDCKPGKAAPLPLAKETVIVREAKKTGEDFISRIDSMKKGEKGWEFSTHERPAANEPFKESAADKAQCAACHAKNEKGDSVFSGMVLKE